MYCILTVIQSKKVADANTIQEKNVNVIEGLEYSRNVQNQEMLVDDSGGCNFV